jgi:hypothetical protein
VRFFPNTQGSGIPQARTVNRDGVYHLLAKRYVAPPAE